MTPNTQTLVNGFQTQKLTSRKPRVLQIITRADLGGAQVHVLDLLRGLRDEFELVLGIGEEGYCTEEARALGVEYRLLPGLVQKMDPLADIVALRSTIRAIRSIRPDLVHCHTSKAGLIGRLAAFLTGVPAIYTAHTWSFAEGTSRAWKLIGLPAETIASRWARYIITVSDANRIAAIHKGVAPASKLVTVHNGIADSALRAKPGIGNVPRIVMVARFVPQKNYSLLIEAVSGLEFPAILTLVGDGPLRPAAEKLASRCPAHIQIEFLGERRNIAEILSRANLFVLSTNWEGFPLSILEAMRAGLPIIATDVDGVRESVAEGDNGILVRAKDSQGLKDAIQSLILDPALRHNMGVRSRALYEHRFSLSAMIRKTTSIYALALKQAHTDFSRYQISPGRALKSKEN